MAEEQSSPQQKLFRLPGTIEEEDCERETIQEQQQQQQQQRSSRPESPLLAQRNNVHIVSGLPKNVTLLRVSTQSSSIAGITRQDSTRSRYRAGPTRKLRRRAVLKSGECNVLQSRISRRSLRFLQDIFTTLVDTQWRWTLLCFALSFVLSWLVFAGIWYLIAFTHGDFEPRHLADPNWRPCVSELHSFTSCFLFSIETQHTIGYGGRATTEECPEAIFVMCAQSISGVMIQALMVGIVFAKMSRPKQRTQTLLFSKQAVICQRDGELCLMFRVGDMRKSHIIGATVRAQLIRSRTTKEGETLMHNQYELAVGADGQTENLFFIWPCTVVHRINADSPFYNMSAEDVLTERFEIVVILEGTIESTGQTTQARSSYLPQELLWGHRFEPLVSYSKERQGYEVDYSRFNSTLQVDTPLCSGRELAEFYRLQDGLRHPNSSGFLLDEELASPVPSESRYQQAICKYLQPMAQQPSLSHHQHHQHHHHHHQQQQQQPQHQNQNHPNHHHNNHQQQQQQQQQRPRSELSLDDKRASNCCSECAAGPPPYGRASAMNRTIELDEEEVSLLASNQNNNNNNNNNNNKTDDKARYRPLEREDSRARFRSCQDLLQRPKQPKQRYLLLALDNSDAELCSSYPSVVPRRHTGSKERLSSLRLARRSKPEKPARRELQEIVVHKMPENKVNDDGAAIAGQLPEAGMPERVMLCCNNGSEASCETNSSSEPENGCCNENNGQLVNQQQQQPTTIYTNV